MTQVSTGVAPAVIPPGKKKHRKPRSPMSGPRVTSKPRQMGFRGFAKPRDEPKRRTFETQNREAAELILEDVEGHGGETSALVIWARSIISKQTEGTCAS